jgi:hypothetical protein
MEVLLALSNTIRLVSVVVKRFLKYVKMPPRPKCLRVAALLTLLQRNSHSVTNADTIAEIVTNCLYVEVVPIDKIEDLL